MGQSYKTLLADQKMYLFRVDGKFVTILTHRGMFHAVQLAEDPNNLRQVDLIEVVKIPIPKYVLAFSLWVLSELRKSIIDKRIP